MIHLSQVSRRYYTGEIETTALHHVNLSIEAGEFLSIMGPSGCGKSTLLNLLGLIDVADEGQFTFMEEDITGFSERKRAQLRKEYLGFVFQSFNLIDELSVFENVELPLVYAKVPTAERKERVEEALGRMNMLHRRNHLPQQLSGGQQQRVAVARAVINRPKLILADEPTGNLDSQHGREVMQMLSDLHQNGTTIVMVTHDPECAAHGNRIIRLLDGKILAENAAPSVMRI
ncbi:ABC transporter ATP-binding protein [Pontibacter sp. G13]|uniref:ABC transporter ATP-binding protein n=1 Tax=Pontibacter sp. G13 TaxID=3074898 RepID=UPI0028899C8D|nr:ABC transporter ATP-binding protein [Pontibacter sp. G13]WNJ17304.1 ABC transporter ATP-binding protein [Pontibacter sp. G13]